MTNARVIGVDSVLEPGWIATSGGTIEAIGAGSPPTSLAIGRETLDARGDTALPGFVDVHVHGAVGHEVMDGNTEGLLAMSSFFARHGVTAYLATTWAAPMEETLRALDCVGQAASADPPGARVLGAHMEGPYLSRTRCGAQDPRSVRPPDLAEARHFLDTGVVRLITVAPELPGARNLVELCLSQGARVSLGHTDASYEQIVEAVTWGARHVTHAFNAMPSLHHRRPGPVGAAMTIKALTAELIADNHHVDPVVLAAFLQAKGPEGITLVTDAVRPTGLEGGEFRLGGRPARLAGDVIRLQDGTMAGSVLTMDVALRNLMRSSGASLERLWPSASRNGAVAAGVADRKGAIAPGLDADLVIVGSDVDVRTTIVGGRVVHSASADLRNRVT